MIGGESVDPFCLLRSKRRTVQRNSTTFARISQFLKSVDLIYVIEASQWLRLLSRTITNYFRRSRLIDLSVKGVKRFGNVNC